MKRVHYISLKFGEYPCADGSDSILSYVDESYQGKSNSGLRNQEMPLVPER